MMPHIAEFIANHTLLMLAFMLVTIALSWNLFRDQAGGIPRLLPSEAVQLINHQDAVVLDVREPVEFERGHIIESIHIPLASLGQHLKKLHKYKNVPIIVSCQSGMRSAQACQTLQKNEFTQLYNLKGGISAWQNAQLPLATAKTKTSKSKLAKPAKLKQK